MTEVDNRLALKRLNWYQQDLFDREGMVNDFINMAEMSEEDIAKLSDGSKARRKAILDDIATTKYALPYIMQGYLYPVQNILTEAGLE